MKNSSNSSGKVTDPRMGAKNKGLAFKNRFLYSAKAFFLKTSLKTMKKDIHPKIYPAIFVDLSTGAEFLSFTTRKTQETKKIGDVEYNIVKVEITSDSHPFFTGKQVLLDTAGRVDKFREKVKKMQEMKEKKVKVVENPEEAAEGTAEKAPKKKAAAKKPAAKKTAAKKK